MTMTQSISAIAPINITDPKFKANPFPFYARLRDEAPVFQITLPTKQRAWLVTRYDDVVAVLKDDRFAKDPHNAMTPEQLKKAPWIPPMFKPLLQNLLGIDNPDHMRLRGLVHKAFTPRLIEHMRDQIHVLTNELLDAVEPRGSMDLIADFAMPLPLIMIGRILGVPADDNPKFHRWTTAFISLGSNPNIASVLPMMRFMSYLRKLIAERTAHPKDDLISAFAQVKEADEQMSADEVLSMVFLLLSAGHETTLNLIASGSLALLENPDQLSKLRSDAALIKPAIEELLRYVCPAEMASQRYAREDIMIADTRIPRGEMVLAVIGSANRDPNVFEHPDTLDIARENNKHVAFGQGAHYCIGAPLSRMEGQIAIDLLIRRFPNLRLSVAPDQLRWRSAFIVRGLESLPVTF